MAHDIVKQLASRTTKTCAPHKSETLELHGLRKWRNREVGDPPAYLTEVKCIDSSTSFRSISASHNLAICVTAVSALCAAT